MAVPKKKNSVSRKGKRRGGHTHKLKNDACIVSCNDSGELTKKGFVSPGGFWKGQKVFETRADKAEEETTED